MRILSYQGLNPGFSFRDLLVKSETPQKQQPIIDLVDKILAITKCDTGIPACENSDTDKNVCATIREYEKQIDQLVYKLYGLTDEEIKIVENS